MRRAHSVRHYPRASLALASDELGALREAGETDEDVLRKQLIEKDRLVDELTKEIEKLTYELTQRPPAEELQEMRREAKNLDILLQGTQRENERCMGELEKAKSREKLLESKLRDLAGENWAAVLDVPPSAHGARSGGTLSSRHIRSATISSGSPIHGGSLSAFGPRGAPSPSPSHHTRRGSHSRNSSFASGNGDVTFTASPTSSPSSASFSHPPSSSFSPSSSGLTVSPGTSQEEENERYLRQQREKEEKEAQTAQLVAKLEQMKLLVLGMDQRLQVREGVLAKSVERAERETKRLETVRKEVGALGVA